MLAVLVNVRAAGLGQQDIVAEVVHLHLLKVKYLRGTILVSISNHRKPLAQIDLALVPPMQCSTHDHILHPLCIWFREDGFRVLWSRIQGRGLYSGYFSWGLQWWVSGFRVVEGLNIL